MAYVPLGAVGGVGNDQLQLALKLPAALSALLLDCVPDAPQESWPLVRKRRAHAVYSLLQV